MVGAVAGIGIVSLGLDSLVVVVVVVVVVVAVVVVVTGSSKYSLSRVTV